MRKVEKIHRQKSIKLRILFFKSAELEILHGVMSFSGHIFLNKKLKIDFDIKDRLIKTKILTLEKKPNY